jgi:hypothetical protein
MMRLALILTMATLLSGCAQFARLTSGGASEVVISATGRDTMTVSIPALNARGVVTPIARNGNVITWKTPDNTTMSFDQGVVVSTRGLGDDLMGADIAHTLAALQGGASNWAPRIHGYMNGEYQSYFATFQCRRTATQPDVVRISGAEYSVTRTDETCLNDELQVENTYWRDRSGVMVKSRQWVSRGVGYMETERAIR